MRPSHEEDTAAALAEIDKDADEYRNIAERRVRLGLLLSEIGQANGIEVSEQEMNRLIGQAAAQYQGKDRERFIQYVQQEPMAAAQLRAPLYEDKVVDFLFSKAEISDRTATRAELEADLESEEGHVHGPGCGHDHAAAAKPAKGKKAGRQAGQGRGQARSREARPRARSTRPRPMPSRSRPSRSRTAPAARRRPRPAGQEAARPKKPPAVEGCIPVDAEG